MKKIFVVLFVFLLMAAVAAPAYADADVSVVSAAPTPEPVEEAYTEPEDDFLPDTPLLSQGAPGRGGIDDIGKYWATFGYPENVSFAYEAGGEMLDDETNVSWWEIGVVDTDEAGRQAILDLLSPNMLVTFRECRYSYAQREAAFDAIYTRSKEDGNILGVQMMLNSEVVMVEIAEEYEKEYAGEFIRQYGSFVVVTNDINAATDAYAGLGGGLKPGAGTAVGVLSFWPLFGIVLLGLAVLLLLNRTRLIPALQTAQGTVITHGPSASAKETILAVKNSEATPEDHVFEAVLKKIEKQ